MKPQNIAEPPLPTVIVGRAKTFPRGLHLFMTDRSYRRPRFVIDFDRKPCETTGDIAGCPSILFVSQHYASDFDPLPRLCRGVEAS